MTNMSNKHINRVALIHSQSTVQRKEIIILQQHSITVATQTSSFTCGLLHTFFYICSLHTIQVVTLHVQWFRDLYQVLDFASIMYNREAALFCCWNSVIYATLMVLTKFCQQCFICRTFQTSHHKTDHGKHFKNM